MGYFISKDEWAEWVADHKEMSEFFGIKKPFREGKNTNKFNILYYQEGAEKADGTYLGEVISSNYLYSAIWHIYKLLKNQEKPEAYEKLVDRLDAISGWLNSKENQQVLEAKVKHLEKAVEALEKKLAKLEKSD